MGRNDAALGLAALLWLAALAPASPPRSACAEAGAESCAAASWREPVALLFGVPLDLNRASPTSLAVLPGIGPARAEAIVAERCRGRFDAVRDIERVRGIGPELARGLAAQVRVEAAVPVSCPGSRALGAGRTRPGSSPSAPRPAPGTVPW